MIPDAELVLSHAVTELRADVFQPLNERLLAMGADLRRSRVTRALNYLVGRGVLLRQLQERRGWDSYQLNGDHPSVKALGGEERAED